MAKKQPSWRKWMLILLFVLPLGLLAGLLIGRAVDPDMLFQGERISSGSDATRRADAAVERRNREVLEEEEEPPASFRSDLDNEDEVWPEDYAARRDGDPGEYEYYFGDDLYSDDALFEDNSRPALEPEPEPESRAQDTAPASPEPSARYAPPGQRDTAPAENREPAQSQSSEPRTADGDLPAIW